jgi:hypothetical protein
MYSYINRQKRQVANRAVISRNKICSINQYRVCKDNKIDTTRIMSQAHRHDRLLPWLSGSGGGTHAPAGLGVQTCNHHPDCRT